MDLDITAWILLTLALLLIKHCWIDFFNQDSDEISRKGRYGDLKGMWHSIKHGIATCLIFAVMGDSWLGGLVLGFLDFSIHYHVDWIKQNYANQSPTTPEFWRAIGLDQLVHQLTYLLLIWMTIAQV
jgi:hypothetical protein